MKKCSRCYETKEFAQFNKCKSAKFGLHNHCRQCQKHVRKEWYELNKETERVKSAEHSKSDKAKAQRKRRYSQNKEVILKVNRERRSTPHARNLANIARQKRMRDSLSFKLSVYLRSRIRVAIIGKSKSASTFELLGCSYDELIIHLENQFKDGMTWDNYGQFGWHIDHIRPCASFDLSDFEQQKICFHYTNLQPLWWRDNLSKGSKTNY